MPAAAKPAIHGLMGKIMADIGAIAKDQRNKAQGFDFRGIDQVYNHLHTIMAKHGVFCTAEILEKAREERPSKSGGVMAFTTLRIRYHFHAPDGSTIASEVIGEGMDSGDKSSNKAMAVAHKYCLLQAFLIPTQEQKDPDADAPELAVDKITADQATAIRAELNRIGKSEKELCAEVRIDSIDGLEAHRFDAAITYLKNIKEKK